MERFEAGFLHQPAQQPSHGLALTHGAGSDCNARLLVALADAFAALGVLVYRYDLPYRCKRPTGPPSPASADADRQGIREAVGALRAKVPGRILAGGHSYGGRQTSMAAGEGNLAADGLLLLSYPLHPPGKPLNQRTAHFPELTVPCLFVHGVRDPFGSPEEMRAALGKISTRHELMLVENAGHELGKQHALLAPEIAGRAAALLLS